MIVACRILVLVLLALAGTAVPAAAQDAAAPAKSKSLPKSPDELELIDVSTVTEIQKSDIITLANGKVYHLDQIRVPVYFEDVAVEHLRSTLQGRKVGIYNEAGMKALVKDRYGYPFVHLMREDGTWVQADMVARGLAWAYSTEASHALVLPLYRYEEEARKMKAGFWERDEYAIRSAKDIGRHVNSYEIYQGKILSYRHDGEYLIFNCDRGPGGPALSFKIRNDRENRFVGGGSRKIYGQRWIGAIARLRGWVDKSDTGVPVIELTHLEQMEFIDPTTGIPTTRLD